MLKNKKCSDSKKDELGEEIMKEFVALTPKMYSYLKIDDYVNQKSKGTKKWIMKREMIFEDCKKGIEKNVIHIVSTLWISGNETKSDVRFSKLHNVDTMLEADVETKTKQRCTTLLQRSIDVVST